VLQFSQRQARVPNRMHPRSNQKFIENEKFPKK
jgi:hypothetical protein